jgi:cob(I)alamin adenosyltransferase
MLRLAIVDQDGKIVKLTDVPTAQDLLALVDQARTVIRDCERLAQQMKTKHMGSGPASVPYAS